MLVVVDQVVIAVPVWPVLKSSTPPLATHVWVVAFHQKPSLMRCKLYSTLTTPVLTALVSGSVVVPPMLVGSEASGSEAPCAGPLIVLCGMVWSTWNVMWSVLSAGAAFGTSML